MQNIKYITKNINYIYLIKLREFIKTNENIYKIGRTSQNRMKRIEQYPKDSELIIFRKCNDCLKTENNLLELFKRKYIHQSRYGNEYFEGNEFDMIKDINNIIDIEKQKEIIKIDMISDINIVKDKHIEDTSMIADRIIDEYSNSNTNRINNENIVSDIDIILNTDMNIIPNAEINIIKNNIIASNIDIVSDIDIILNTDMDIILENDQEIERNNINEEKLDINYNIYDKNIIDNKNSIPIVIKDSNKRIKKNKPIIYL